ncbi:hypothetical protein N7462_003967 [Penicillium macrosclerotiorum]|uniref:uncharacterized protein n=1 Tax=Penicillium macrosclerotiorum TaxID=303699 RepID=UPI002548A9FD|nr:uncharacterized protein N7462_003967 [Penicillium macrosclerotiorum]KAJ5689575.1 hypothetical protein N7462_003967 [Penicillium macrosclerotiorum]
MTCTDKFTKRVGYIPGRADWDGESWAKPLLTMFMSGDWGLPTVIISDRDPKFVQGLWATIFTILGINLLYTTAYHPQADGQSERSNQSSALPNLQASMNSSINVSTGYTPHKLMYGTELRQAFDMMPQAFDHDTEFQARVDAEQSLAYAAMKMKTYFDKKHKPIHFQAGEWVYLKLSTDTTDPGYSIPANADKPRKFKQRYLGRFQILHRVGRLAYKLKLPDSWQRHPVISVEHLEKCPQGPDPWDRQADNGHHMPTDDERFPDEERYEVAKILAKRITKPRGRPRADGTSRPSITKYLVRWKGQSAKEDQWVAKEDIAADDLIAEFEASRPSN